MRLQQYILQEKETETSVLERPLSMDSHKSHILSLCDQLCHNYYLLLRAHLCLVDIRQWYIYMYSVGGNALQVTWVTYLDYFFQVTSKVTHYFLIYKKISELLFQKK